MKEESDGKKGNICFSAIQLGFHNEQGGKNKQCWAEWFMQL